MRCICVRVFLNEKEKTNYQMKTVCGNLFCDMLLAILKALTIEKVEDIVKIYLL